MKALILAATLFGIVGAAYAEETVTEKAQAAGHDVERGAKKGVNRVKEAVCTDSDAECLAKKAQHRAEEGADYTKDKAKEIKNDVDTDKK